MTKKQVELAECIKKLLLLKKCSKVLINGKHECTIKNAKPFASFIRDESCPMYSSYALVKVTGHDKLAKILVTCNIDLRQPLSCSICFYEKDGEEIASQVTVTKVEFL